MSEFVIVNGIGYRGVVGDMEAADLARLINEVRELSAAAVGIVVVALFVALVVAVQLHFTRGNLARVRDDLEAFRTSAEATNAKTQALVASVPGVKKPKKPRKGTSEVHAEIVRAEIEAKERDTSGRTMIGAPPTDHGNATQKYN